MKVKAESDAPAPGSWTSEAKEQTASLPESVQNAVSGMTGVSYSPIAVLGTQIVAGKNYCILAYGKTVTAEPVTGLYVLYVYEKTDGTAEVNAVSALDLAAYVTAAKTFFAPVEELGAMAKIDYEKKNGVACYAAESVLNEAGTEVTVKLTDADGKLLDTYTIDPYTGEGKSASGAEISLPQTGNTSPRAAAAASGAVLMALAGLFTAIRSGMFRFEKRIR